MMVIGLLVRSRETPVAGTVNPFDDVRADEDILRFLSPSIHTSKFYLHLPIQLQPVPQIRSLF